MKTQFYQPRLNRYEHQDANATPCNTNLPPSMALIEAECQTPMLHSLVEAEGQGQAKWQPVMSIAASDLKRDMVSTNWHLCAAACTSAPVVDSRS
jgi:hypothetical protein